MARYIDIEPVLTDKVSNAYVSRFELEQQPAVDVVSRVDYDNLKSLLDKAMEFIMWQL